jgi:non-specific serine/threonine protein kinase
MATAVQYNYERAAALHAESLSLARRVEDNFAIALSLALGAFTSLRGGDHRRAMNLCAKGLELSQQLKMRQLIATYLHISAASAGSQGQPARSARLWGAAEALREAVGTVFSPVERSVYIPYIVASRAQLDEMTWEAAWNEGKAMTLEAAVECARSEKWSAPATTAAPEEPSASVQPTPLSCREQEIAVLVRRGMTNRQISAEMTLSEHTVATHVSKILTKLGARSRSQIAAWITEQTQLRQAWPGSSPRASAHRLATQLTSN